MTDFPTNSGESSKANHVDEDGDRDSVELLLEEFSDAIRNGHSPSIDQYAADHPDHADRIRDLFPLVMALEESSETPHTVNAYGALPAQPPLTPDARLGDFCIIREIGRGGMGVVYEAHQESLGRRVALKLLPRQAIRNERLIQQFEREARIAARLHHTNLVSLHGVGEHEGHYFLVMELIQGASLDRVLDHVPELLDAPRSAVKDVSEQKRSGGAGSNEEEDVDAARQLAQRLAGYDDAGNGAPRSRKSRKAAYFRKIAKIGRDAAHAIDYAARQGVLHRDIKPGNLILDHEARVHISDFGISRPLDLTASANAQAGGPEEPVRVTKTVDGTFAYMAPESFRGHLDRRSDIYSLGVTIYELLTREPAWRDGGLSEAMKRVADDSFTVSSLRAIDDAIPRDLETIVMKAAAAEPRQRYARAGDLAADLDRFLEDRPIAARRSSRVEHAIRWASRNRLSAALLGLACSLMLLFLGVLSVSYLRVQQSNAEVTASLGRETRLRERSQEALSVATSALNQIFDEFVPPDLVHSNYVPGGGNKSDQVADIPPETAAVMDSLIKFYDRLSDQTDSRDEVGVSSIRAMGRVGDLYLYLGQPDRARQRYIDAIETIWQRRENPDWTDGLAVEAARLCNQIGLLYYRQRQYTSANAWHEKAIEQLNLRQTGRTVPADEMDAARFQEARACYYLGRRQMENPLRVAIDHLSRPQHPPGGGPPRHGPPQPGGPPSGGPPRGFPPPDRDRRGRRPPPRNSTGPFGPVSTSTNVKRREQLLKAISILQSASPDNAPGSSHAFFDSNAYRFLLACTQRELGGLSGGDHEQQATLLLRQLAAQSGQNALYRYELVETLRRRNFDQSLSNASAAAITALDEALVMIDGLLAEDPDNLRYQISRMHVLHRRGHVCVMRAGRSDQPYALVAQAVENLTAAKAQMQSVLKLAPEIETDRLWALVVEGSLIDALLLSGQQQRAVDSIAQAAEHYSDWIDLVTRRHGLPQAPGADAAEPAAGKPPQDLQAAHELASVFIRLSHRAEVSPAPFIKLRDEF